MRIRVFSGSSITWTLSALCLGLVPICLNIVSFLILACLKQLTRGFLLQVDDIREKTVVDRQSVSKIYANESTLSPGLNFSCVLSLR